MLSIRRKSRPLHTSTSFPLALIVALAVGMVAPVAGQAAPEPGEPPQLAFEPAGYDFGLQGVEWGSQQATLQLRNNGTEPASTENYELTGPGTEAFWIGYSDCGWRVLQPGETCSVQVYFSPRDAAEYTVELRVKAESHTFSAELSGEGGRASFAPSSNPTDFGTAAVGSAGVTREIEISNAGNLPGGVFIAVISGGAIGSFQLLDENCTGVLLAPAATCTVQVRFLPLSEGAKKATLALFGESDGGAQAILSGMGSAPAPVLDGPAVAGQAGAFATGANTVDRHRARPLRRRPHRLRRANRRAQRAGLKAARRIATASVGRGRAG